MNSTGRQLHSDLADYAGSMDGSWLKPVWDASYLEFRDPLNGNMNYATVLDTKHLPRGKSFSGFCALLVYSMVKVYRQIASGTLEKDIGTSGCLCMQQYGNVFASCRIPMPGSDRLFTVGKPAENACIAVFYRGNIYILPVIKDGDPVGTWDLASGIGEIMGRKDAPAANIGIMTCAPREDAASFRRHLTGLSALNGENLGKIEAALFALCIDEPPGGKRSAGQAVWDVLHGNGANRWFDKSVQAVVGTDYTVGFNNEHTGFDVAIWINLLRKIYRDMQEAEQVVAGPAKPGSATLQADRLDWVTDDRAAGIIKKMEEDDRAKGKSLHLRLFEFNGFGSSHVKGLKASPDAFFHLALQLAWFRIKGRQDSVYESVAVRNFCQGRTECMRPATAAAGTVLDGKGLPDWQGRRWRSTRSCLSRGRGRGLRGTLPECRQCWAEGAGRFPDTQRDFLDFRGEVR